MVFIRIVAPLRADALALHQRAQEEDATIAPNIPAPRATGVDLDQGRKVSRSKISGFPKRVPSAAASESDYLDGPPTQFWLLENSSRICESFSAAHRYTTRSVQAHGGLR